jgi:hypothetical protein
MSAIPIRFSETGWSTSSLLKIADRALVLIGRIGQGGTHALHDCSASRLGMRSFPSRRPSCRRRLRGWAAPGGPLMSVGSGPADHPSVDWLFGCSMNFKATHTHWRGRYSMIRIRSPGAAMFLHHDQTAGSYECRVGAFSPRNRKECIVASVDGSGGFHRSLASKWTRSSPFSHRDVSPNTFGDNERRNEYRAACCLLEFGFNYVGGLGYLFGYFLADAFVRQRKSYEKFAWNGTGIRSVHEWNYGVCAGRRYS